MSLRQGSLDLPRPFGPYQLLRQVAVGGMAEVYLAKTRGIGGFEKLTALKMIHPRYSEDEHFVQMLVEEAKISVLLNHVNVAQTFDLGCIDGTYFITMEFVEGADAYRVMRRASELGVQIPIETCIFVASEVCAGIDYAHRKRDAEGRPLGIIHRDISPQNILISFTGEVKVVDFGIAKAALRSQETEAGVIKGKYYYMSPEQAWGDPVDQRTDIFSTGVILYELLTGQMLYLEDNISMLLDRVRKAEVDPPTTRRAEISPELSQIVMKALAKYPEERFATAAAMGQALTRLLYRLAPDYTPTRLAQLMGWLFEPELKRGAAPRQPSGESVLAGSTQDGPGKLGADADGDSSSIIFRDPQSSIPPAPTSRPLPPRPKGGRELPASLGGGAPTARPPRGRDPTAPTAALPIPDPSGSGSKGAVRAAPAPVGRPLPQRAAQRAEPDPSESGERRRADQPTARLPSPEAKGSAAVAQKLADLPRFDSEVDAQGDDGDATEMWENETLVDEDGRFDGFVEELRRGPAAAAAQGPGGTAPGADDLDEKTSVMDSMHDSVTLTGDVRSPFSPAGQPEVVKVGAMPTDLEAATRGVRMPRPGELPSNPPGATAQPGRPAAAPSSARTAPAAPRAPAGPPAPLARARATPSAWPPPTLAAPRPTPQTGPTPFPVVQPPPPPPPPAPTHDPFGLPPASAVATAAYAAVEARPRRYLWLWAVVGLLALGVAVLAVALFAAPEAPAPELEVISVPAGATVSLDGKPITGSTPLTVREGLVAGRTHRLEVRLSGYAIWGTSVVATAGLVKQIAILSPLRGTVRVETDPAGAQVFVDGSYRGSTPLVLTELEATRELALRVTLPGYRDESRTVRLGDRLDQTLRIVLAQDR